MAAYLRGALPRPGSAPVTRTGTSYLDALRDGRHVVIDGETVNDVTAHPAFRRSAGSLCPALRRGP